MKSLKSIRAFDTAAWMARKDVRDILSVNDWWRKVVLPSVPTGITPAGVVYLHPAYFRALVSLHGSRTSPSITYLDGVQIAPDPDVPRRDFDLLPPEE